jgi:type II secretion system (T2SS) protein M
MSLELTIPRIVRQALALALLFVPLLVLATALWSYVSGALQHRERIALLEREKAGYEAVLAARPAWDRQLVRLRHAVTGGRLLYAGKTADGDAKAMQTRVAALIAAAGGSGVQDKITVGTSSADGPTQIHDDVSFMGTMAQLRTVLYQLKLSQPLLLPQRLGVHAANADSAGRLRVELGILGFASPS